MEFLTEKQRQGIFMFFTPIMIHILIVGIPSTEKPIIWVLYICGIALSLGMLLSLKKGRLLIFLFAVCTALTIQGIFNLLTIKAGLDNSLALGSILALQTYAISLVYYRNSRPTAFEAIVFIIAVFTIWMIKG